MTTAKEKLVKIKDKLKRNAVKAGIVVASMATLTACSPKQQQSENKEKTEQVSEQYIPYSQLLQEELQEQTSKFKQMVAEGKNLNEYTKWGGTALDDAINWDNLEGAEILLKAGADPNHPLGQQDHDAIPSYTYRGHIKRHLQQTPVFNAQSLEMVKLLEKYGADLNYKDKSGHQPLFYLGGHNTEWTMERPEWNDKIAAYLLEKGNSLDNLQQFRPDNADKIKFCLEHGIKRDMQELLMQTIELGDADAVRYVLEHGGKKYINTLYTDGYGHTNLPISMAAGSSLDKYGHEKIKLLIENGADIHKECDYGSALQRAEGNETMVAFLKQCAAEHTAKMQKMTMSKER